MLNKNQLLEIKTFIEKRGFTQPDVQMEILDHVASAVEEMMVIDQSLGFDKALKQTHQSFGVIGFAAMADGISNAIRKKYNKLFLSYFFCFFSYRYILLTALSGWLIYALHQRLSQQNLYVFFICGLMIECGILMFSGIQARRYKKYLAFQSGTTYLSSLGAILLFTNFAILKTPSKTAIYDVNVVYLISTLSIVLFVLYFYAAIKTVKASMDETMSLIDKYKLVS